MANSAGFRPGGEEVEKATEKRGEKALFVGVCFIFVKDIFGGARSVSGYQLVCCFHKAFTFC